MAAVCGGALLAAGTSCQTHPPAPVSKAPGWVSSGGHSPRHPDSVYVTGFAMAFGDRALERARAEAAADLAGRISVRIEHELRDVTAERDGEYSYEVAAVTRATSDIKLSGLEFESYEDKETREAEGPRVYALAVLERSQAISFRRSERAKAIAEVRACLDSAARHEAEGHESDALATFETCRLPIAEALEHEAVVRALIASDSQPGPSDARTLEELVAANRSVDDGVRGIVRRPVSSTRDAVESLAIQLENQGFHGDGPMTVAPLTYGTVDLSSRFGRQMGLDLEGALMRRARRTRSAAAESTPHCLVRGVYFERGDEVHLSVTVKRAESAELVASAAATLARSAIPSELALRPSNFNAALADQNILAEGELLSGDLRVDLWTDRGKRGVLYAESDELKLFFKVNREAWVRLVYVLQNGMQVPIDQGYFIDPSMVNRAIEYPETFEIVPPFGVEHISATAFSESPAPLVTEVRQVDGVDYDVVVDGLEASLKKTRGLRRKQSTAIAEAFVTVTTTPADLYAP